MYKPSRDFVKYNSGNPVKRALIRGFQKAEKSLLAEAAGVKSVHEVGCGDGYNLNLLAEFFAGKAVVCGSDIELGKLERAAGNAPGVELVRADVFGLPFENGSFDLVAATEVLEHLGRAEDALAEIRRVTRRWALISVPREPLWSSLKLAAAANLRTLGNDPGHVRRWDATAFARLVGRFFRVRRVLYPLPWQILLAEKAD